MGVNYDQILCYRCALLQSCWEEKPEERPTFAKIVNKLEHYLEFIGEYFDISGLRVGDCTDEEASRDATPSIASPTGQSHIGSTEASTNLLPNDYRIAAPPQDYVYTTSAGEALSP